MLRLVGSKEEKASWLIFIVSFLVYSVISMTKSAYSASIASIIEEGIFTKTQAGIINSGFYIFYGGTQIVGIKLVQKLSPLKYLYFALFGTIACLLGMACSHNFYSMLILWCLCGFVQFAVWPAEIRIISEFVLPEHQAKSMTLISFAYCFGTLLNYLLATVILKISRWQMLFIVSAIILFVFIVLWWATLRSTQNTTSKIKKINQEFNERKLKEAISKESSPATSYNFGKLLISSGVIFLLGAGFIKGMLDNGLKTWVPTVILESYPDVTVSFTTMLTTVLIFVNLSGIFIANFIKAKITKNLASGIGICFMISLPFVALLLFTGKIHVLWVAALFTAFTTMMYAVHQFINVLTPASFAKYNCAGSISAILTALASFGIVVASFLFGFLAENFGWTTTMISWIVFCAVALLLCLLASPLWKKFIKE